MLAPVLPLTGTRGAAVYTFRGKAQEESQATRRLWSTKMHDLAVETTGLWQQFVKGYAISQEDMEDAHTAIRPQT